MEYDIDELRAERERRGIKQRDIAEDLGLDATQLSHIESGRRVARPGVLKAYAQSLGFASAEPASNASVPKFQQVVGRILALIQTFRPYRLSQLRMWTDNSGHSNAYSKYSTSYIENTPNDLRHFCEQIIAHNQKNRTKYSISSEDILTFIWNSLRDYDGTLAKVRYSTILSFCIRNNATFNHLFVPSGPEQAVDETAWLLRKQLQTVYFKSRVNLDAVSSLNYGLFPIDFFVLHNKIGCIRFSTTAFNAKEGLIVEKDIGPLNSYVRRIAKHREHRVSIFRGEGDIEAFLDAYGITESASGPRLLAQRSLGSHTRSPDDYNENTSWWARYQNLTDKFKLNIKLERFAANRNRTHTLLLQRALNFPIKQICSREAIEDWAADHPQPSFSGAMVHISRSDRLARVSYILHLLRNYDKFSIAVIDDKEGEQLGWNVAGKKRNVVWLVQGKDKVIFETTVQNDAESTDSDNSAEKKYNAIRGTEREIGMQIIMQSEPIAQAFHQFFESVWSKLKRDSGDKKLVIDYFEGLKSRIR